MQASQARALQLSTAREEETVICSLLLVAFSKGLEDWA